MPDQPENYIHISVALRDYFAAMAMQGFIIGDMVLGNVVGQSNAIEAYYMADLMLAMREKVAS